MYNILKGGDNMNNDMMIDFIKGCLNEKGNKRLKNKRSGLYE